MSVQAMSWVIEHSQHKGSSFVVLLMIANHAHSDGSGAYPSFDTLARESRITVRQVTNIIPLLERSRELTVQRGAGPHGTHLYSLSMLQDRLPMENSSNGKPLVPISNEPLEPSKELREPPKVAALPVWVPEQEWKEFVEMRQKIRAPMTEAAKKRTLDDLWKLMNAGQDLKAVLGQSVQRGWRGVFEVKNGGSNGQETSWERRSRTSAEAIERVSRRVEAVDGDIRRALPSTH